MKSPGLRPSRPESPERQKREHALRSAIALRQCSLGPQGSGSGRGTFRTLMREQALRWRQSTLAGLQPVR
jgi:hypothetical protein